MAVKWCIMLLIRVDGSQRKLPMNTIRLKESVIAGEEVEERRVFQTKGNRA